MSIEEEDPKKAITMGTLMAWLFKANQVALPLFGSFFIWSAYQVGSMAIADHGRIGASETEIRFIKRYFGIASAAVSLDHKAYLTTADIARAEGKTTDTVRRWIKDGKILPRPRKDAKTGEYIFDSDYILVSTMEGSNPIANDP